LHELAFTGAKGGDKKGKEDTNSSLWTSKSRHKMEDRLDPFSIKEKGKVVDEGEMSASSTPSGEPHEAWVEGGEGEGKFMTWSCDWKCGLRSIAQHEKNCTRSHEQCHFVERRWILTAGPSHTGDREVSNTPHPRYCAQHL